MSAGFIVPQRCHAMAAFPGPEGMRLIVRNHEVNSNAKARGEGMSCGNDAVYFACTHGGRKEKGRVWRYFPNPHEGAPEEQNDPGKLELFVEPNDGNLIENADHLTVAPWGDVMVCENRDSDARLVGVTPQGGFYVFDKNVASDSEPAGAAFSPDGSTLFVPELCAVPASTSACD